MQNHTVIQQSEVLEYPHLHLEALHIARLSQVFWNGIQLDGHFWRLYHNDSRGAGVWINGKKTELSPDSLYLIPPNCQLTTWCDGNPVQLYLHFELTRIAGRPGVSLNGIRLDDRLKHLINEIRTCYAGNPQSARLPLLAIALASNAMVMTDPEMLQEVNPDRRITLACDKIRSNLSVPLNLESLAAESGFVPNAFLRKFREVTGATPYQYILTLRYAMAARLLKTTDMSIDSICEQIGVNDRFHFSRKFKIIYGLPPGEYRKASLSVIPG